MIEYLKKVRDYLAIPSQWRQRHLFVTAYGCIVTHTPWEFAHRNKDEIKGCCLVGALCLHASSPVEVMEARSLLRERLPSGFSLETFNDKHTHVEVIAFLDETINSLLGVNPEVKELLEAL